MVVVNVEDCNPPVDTLLQCSGRDGGVVQVAEPTVQIMPRMVAWRPAQGVGSRRTSVHQFGGRSRTLSTPVCCLPRSLNDRTRGVEREVANPAREFAGLNPPPPTTVRFSNSWL